MIVYTLKSNITQLVNHDKSKTSDLHNYKHVLTLQNTKHTLLDIRHTNLT